MQALCGVTLFVTVMVMGPLMLLGGLILMVIEEVKTMERFKCKGK